MDNNNLTEGQVAVGFLEMLNHQMETPLNISTAPRRPGKRVLTEQEKDYIKSFAVDGVIPFDDYIRAINFVLNS